MTHLNKFNWFQSKEEEQERQQDVVEESSPAQKSGQRVWSWAGRDQHLLRGQDGQQERGPDV